MEQETSSQPTPSPQGDDKKADESQLQVLKRQLYARDEPAEIAERTRRLSDLPTRKAEPYQKVVETSPTQFSDELARRTATRRRLIKTTLIVGGLAVIFLVAVGSTIWYRSAHQVAESQIGLTISAPEEFVSGDEISYAVNFENTSLEEWQRVRVEFQAPAGFHFLGAQPSVRRDGPVYVYDAPNVASQAKGELRLQGKLIGELNDSLLAKAVIVFSPANDPKGERSKTVSFTTTIRAVPIEVSLQASNTAVSGERLLAVVTVRNTGSVAQEGLYLALKVPPGMQLALEDAEFSKEFDVEASEWILPVLRPLEELTRTVVFYVEGATQENRSLEVEAGVAENDEKFVQRALSHVVVIAASELAVEQEYNGVLDDQIVLAGQRMQAKIKFNNTGTTGLKSVVVAAKIEGVGFDPASLQLQGGSYNPTTKTITWTSATVPELAVMPAGQAGEIPFSFLVLPTAQIPTPADAGSNNAIIITASVDSPDIVTSLGEQRRVVSDRTVLSLKTNLALETAAFYDDGRLGVTSEGPTPPEVGQKTTYTLRFRLGSTLNDTGDVKMIAVLPDGVAYTGQTYKTNGAVDFNERTGEVTWRIPLLKGLTGRTAPAEELHVQVAITPGEDKRNQVIQLVKSLTVEGMDVFVDEVATAQVDIFPTTETAVPGKGRVE